MTVYEALSDGFYDGADYGPNRKRRFVQTDKPLKPVPKWLKEVKQVKQTAAQIKAAKKKEAEIAKLEKSNKTEVAAANFLDGNDPKASTQPNVETL